MGMEYGSPQWAIEHGAVVALTLENAPVSDLEAYVAAAHRVVESLGPEGTAAYRGNESALTEHAAALRSIGAHLILLEKGAIPALKIDSECPSIRMVAASTAGYIDAQLKVMRHKLERLPKAA